MWDVTFQQAGNFPPARCMIGSTVQTCINVHVHIYKHTTDTPTQWVVGRGVICPPSSSVEIPKRVELYLYSNSVPS
jgi:hypothetical protein